MMYSIGHGLLYDYLICESDNKDGNVRIVMDRKKGDIPELKDYRKKPNGIKFEDYAKYIAVVHKFSTDCDEFAIAHFVNWIYEDEAKEKGYKI